MKNLPSSHRKAKPDDAGALAYLINLAGGGLPKYLWGQMANEGENALDIGRQRAVRETGGFSYKNAIVREVEGRVAAMLLGEQLPDPYEAGDLTSIPEIVRPAIELESLAPGSWYINAIAAFPEFQSRGFGTDLLKLAEQLALGLGAGETSLIVSEENIRAKALYDRLGYITKAGRLSIPFEGMGHGGDWLLMVKPLNG